MGEHPGRAGLGAECHKCHRWRHGYRRSAHCARLLGFARATPRSAQSGEPPTHQYRPHREYRRVGSAAGSAATRTKRWKAADVPGEACEYQAVNGILRHLPNALTGARVIAAPAIALLLLRGLFEAAFAVFVLAGLPDALDGYPATRFAPGSQLGV